VTCRVGAAQAVPTRQRGSTPLVGPDLSLEHLTPQPSGNILGAGRERCGQAKDSLGLASAPSSSNRIEQQCTNDQRIASQWVTTTDPASGISVMLPGQPTVHKTTSTTNGKPITIRTYVQKLTDSHGAIVFMVMDGATGCGCPRSGSRHATC
jgi:hypothetical protein